jgi:N-acetylmuramoyl-L-alanine amidase
METPAQSFSAAHAAHGRKAWLCAVATLCILLGRPASGAPPVRELYTDALAREQAIRVALAVPDAPLKLEEVRAVVNLYEAIVRQYPASGYSDNALWHAAHLALDAFWRFGELQDKETTTRLLQKLATNYPTSKLAKQVPAELRQAVDAAPRHANVAANPRVVPRQARDDPEPGARIGREGGHVSPPPRPSSLATIREIRRVVLPDAVRVTIELDSEVSFHDEHISDPERVFLDLPGTKPAPSLVDRTLRFESDADIVRQVRLGRHPNNVTRVVLDAAGVTSYSVYPLYSPYRLVIDCVRAKEAAPAATNVAPMYTLAARPAIVPPPVTPAATPVAAAPATLTARRVALWQRAAPAVTPQHSVIIAMARSSEMEAIPAPASPPPASSHPSAEVAVEPPAKNVAGGLSMARQLGLGVSRIVIDPGHGGHDPGAKGKGVSEAELVLDVALRLEKLLQKVPGVDVILTRRTDDFIALPERTAIANREGADLFLSIHANASTSAQAHGIETYFLNFANNQTAAALAARENATSAQTMGALPDFVKAIALNNKLDESRDFATQVQRAMVERLRTSNRTLRDLGVKQAPFVVLIGAVMPSVLAEISFVTNPQEARLLKANVYRQRIAEALFNAIRKYQTSLKHATSVASQ